MNNNYYEDITETSLRRSLEIISKMNPNINISYIISVADLRDLSNVIISNGGFWNAEYNNLHQKWMHVFKIINGFIEDLITLNSVYDSQIILDLFINDLNELVDRYDSFDN